MKIQRNKPREAKYAMPITLDYLVDIGEFDEFAFPEKQFEPKGHWEHMYRIWLWHGSKREECEGYFGIYHEPHEDNRLTLMKIETAFIQITGTVHQMKANVKCAVDRLFTPKSWELDAVILGIDLQPINDTRRGEKATVKNGVVEVTVGKHIVKKKVPAVYTGNWMLFNAVQCLPKTTFQPIEFDLLEDLDLHKPNQRLYYNQSRKIKLRGKKVQLHEYRQIGEGIWPYHYWVDDNQRLLVAYSGVRAYIFDPRGRDRALRYQSKKQKRSSR